MSEKDTRPEECGAYAFDTDNGDGRRSICAGCDRLATGRCSRRTFPIIGKTSFKPTDPKFIEGMKEMTALAKQMREVCRPKPQ